MQGYCASIKISGRSATIQKEPMCTKLCITVMKISLVLRHVPAPILVQSIQSTGASVNCGTGYDMGIHYTYHLHRPKPPIQWDSAFQGSTVYPCMVSKNR